MSAPIEDEFLTLSRAIDLFSSSAPEKPHAEWAAELSYAIHKKILPANSIKSTRSVIRIITGDLIPYDQQNTKVPANEHDVARKELISAWGRKAFNSRVFDQILIDRLVLQNWAQDNQIALPPALSLQDYEKGKLLWQRLAVREGEKYFDGFKRNAKKGETPPGLKKISEYLEEHQVRLGISNEENKRTANTIRTEALIGSDITGRKPKGR